MKFINDILSSGDIWGAPDGALTLVLAAASESGKPLIYVARDDARLASVKAGLQSIAPKLQLLVLPAWDCLPFDRLSPRSELIGNRVSTLAKLAVGETPSILLTTINAILQKLPPLDYFVGSCLEIIPGSIYGTKSFTNW